MSEKEIYSVDLLKSIDKTVKDIRRFVIYIFLLVFIWFLVYVVLPFM